MNKNDYRRALIMLRSLRVGVSGYVRLERRTLIGTLHFTVNGVQEDGSLHAVLLYRQGGSWYGVRVGDLATPRYGQTGLVWKFDPRNIEGRTLEQYDLAAIIEIRSGVCDLLLCGHLNGSVDADMSQIREVSCRLFTATRISGNPIAAIEEKDDFSPVSTDFSASDLIGESVSQDISSLQAECTGVCPPSENGGSSPEPPAEASAASTADISVETDSKSTESLNAASTSEASVDSCELDMPAKTEALSFHSAPSSVSVSDMIESDEIDTPAGDQTLQNPSESSVTSVASSIELDELDTPAQGAMTLLDSPSKQAPTSAGDLLALTDRDSPWPRCIASLKKLFFSSEPVTPFDAQGYVFIQAPLPENADSDFCVVGLYCEDGVPSRVCYALPAAYAPEPPIGLEGYVWRGDSNAGYWTICEAVVPD